MSLLFLIDFRERNSFAPEVVAIWQSRGYVPTKHDYSGIVSSCQTIQAAAPRLHVRLLPL